MAPMNGLKPKRATSEKGKALRSGPSDLLFILLNPGTLEAYLSWKHFSFKILFLSSGSYFSLDRCSIPSREVSILWSYLDITLLFSSYVYLIFIHLLKSLFSFEISFGFRVDPGFHSVASLGSQL